MCKGYELRSQFKELPYVFTYSYNYIIDRCTEVKATYIRGDHSDLTRFIWESKVILLMYVYIPDIRRFDEC